MRRISLFLAAALLAAMAGCVAVVEDRHGHSSHSHTRKTVVVPVAHVCFDSCDHYHIDGVWYVETGHRHRSGCGHYLVKGKWRNHKGDDDDDDDDDRKDKGKKRKKDDD